MTKSEVYAVVAPPDCPMYGGMVVITPRTNYIDATVFVGALIGCPDWGALKRAGWTCEKLSTLAASWPPPES